MRVFGITGGSGSGKTTFSKIMSELGVYIIDTDVIAHRITEKGEECLNELADYFGNDILNVDGTLNRKELAKRAFSKESEKTALNRITHKYIKEETIRLIEQTDSDIVGIDGAVIIGSNIQPLCEFIVSVISEKEVRMQRLRERDNLSDEQINLRLSAQPDDKFYIENSLYIIYNNGDLKELQRQAQQLYKRIKEV